MRKKLSWYVVGLLILGLVLLTVSCGGTATAPSVEEEPAIEEPAVEEPVVEEPVVEEPAAEEPAAVASMAIPIPHTLEGRGDCLVCHGEGKFKPFPVDHAGRTSDTCTGCHQAAE